MPADAGMLRVFETGPRTKIGFAAVQTEKTEAFAQCRQQLEDLVKANQCEVLEVDLSGVVNLPSTILAQLALFRRRGVAIELYHASQDIRHVLQISRLDRELTVVEEPAAADGTSDESNDGRLRHNGSKQG